MADLENQIRSLSLGPGPPVVTRYMSGPGLVTASRGQQQPRTGPVVQVTSPAILNGRTASRNDAR